MKRFLLYEEVTDVYVYIYTYIYTYIIFIYIHIYIYTYIYIYIHLTDVKTADQHLCVTRRWHVFLFSSEKLEKNKHFKLIVSHLGTDFTYTLNHYCLFIKRQYTNILTLFYVYFTNIFICIIHVYI